MERIINCTARGLKGEDPEADIPALMIIDDDGEDRFTVSVRKPSNDSIPSMVVELTPEQAAAMGERMIEAGKRAKGI